MPYDEFTEFVPEQPPDPYHVRVLRALFIVVIAAMAVTFACKDAGADTLDKVVVATVPTLGVLAALDAHGTIDCVRLGTCHEANPFLRPLVDRHGIEVAMGSKLAVQGGLVAVSLWAMHRYPEHRKGIVLGLVTATVLQGVVVGLNQRTLRNAQ